LRLAIEKVRQQNATKTNSHIALNDSFVLDQKIPLLYHNNYVLTDISDIVLLEADNNYTRFFITTADPIIMSKTLKEYEMKLTSFGFYRVHKSSLINLKHIKEYSLSDGGYVIMSNKMKIPISRRKHQEFKTLISRSIN
jgi:two-component system LytT family response regulator